MPFTIFSLPFQIYFLLFTKAPLPQQLDVSELEEKDKRKTQAKKDDIWQIQIIKA